MDCASLLLAAQVVLPGSDTSRLSLPSIIIGSRRLSKAPSTAACSAAESSATLCSQAAVRGASAVDLAALFEEEQSPAGMREWRDSQIALGPPAGNAVSVMVAGGASAVPPMAVSLRMSTPRASWLESTPARTCSAPPELQALAVSMPLSAHLAVRPAAARSPGTSAATAVSWTALLLASAALAALAVWCTRSLDCSSPASRKNDAHGLCMAESSSFSSLLSVRGA
jgi:hypothetical protein